MDTSISNSPGIPRQLKPDTSSIPVSFVVSSPQKKGFSTLKQLRCITAFALSLPHSQDSLQRFHFPCLTCLYSLTALIWKSIQNQKPSSDNFQGSLDLLHCTPVVITP